MKKRLVKLLAGLLTILSMGFGLAQFSDVPAGHWAQEAVEVLAARGIIIGFPDGTFRGNEGLTRYQAALIIYRLLQQIEEELRAAGEAPTLEALSPEDLEVLRNAVQELAAELAALGVRVSALEDSAATKEDIARLEALIEELRAQPMPEVEPGMDQAALQDLVDRVEAASIAADTALAQAQQLAEQLEALVQDVEGVKGDVAALTTRLEASEQAVQALNELAVLLNQDLLALQDRVTALEKALAEREEAPALDLEELATKEDVAAVQEFAAALRSDLVNLSERVSRLEGQVAELSKVQYSIKGSLTATYGTATNTGIDFDIDRLFPGNKVSSGSGQQDYGAGPPYRNRVAQRRGDFNQNFTEGSASLSFGVKVVQPGQQGVNVSEASVDLSATAFPGPTTVSVDGASVKGNVDGQPFSVVYSSSTSSFSFNDYLFANDQDNYPATDRQGFVATFSGTKLPLRPEVTVVVGQATDNSNATVPPNQRAFVSAPYFGIRTAFNPLEGFSLAVNYGANDGNRAALGFDASLALGPVKLSALWDSSRTWGSPLSDWFDSTLSDWAYYVKGDLALGPLSLSANYRAIDPEYENGVAGMSSNYHWFYFGVGGNGKAPFAANNKGFGVDAKVNLDLLGGLEVRAYYDDSTDYAGTPATQQVAYGVGATLKLFAGFALNPFYNSLTVGGNVQPGSTGLGAYGNYNAYFYNIPDSRYSTGFGVKLTHDAKAKDALIPGLAITLGYQLFDDGSGSYPFSDVLASASYQGKLAFLNLQPYVRYHSFSDALVGTGNTRPAAYIGYNGANTYSYTTFKFGIKAATDPLDIPLKPALEGVYAQRVTTDITQHNNSTGVNTALPDATERYYRLGLTFNEFLAPNVVAKVGYASYRGQNVVDPAGSFLTRGYGDFSLSAGTDRLFTYPGEVQFPWNLTTGAGTGSGGVDGIYLEVGYYGLTVAYLDAVLLDGTGNVQSYGRAFKISYTTNF
ncbi:S-layer homology domain-containing protein [Thermus sediminis]|uniref:S-layer homology domain-containing protein n=1 Tax=Thermus sediminis TaxID=1761908 RepID=UPI000E3DD828|nr:S-layer homology domain-containing protein [Thermus sediminis]